jgi:dienelactone hydrolase
MMWAKIRVTFWTLAATLSLVLPGVVRAQEKISIPSFTPASTRNFVKHEGPQVNVSGELYMPASAKGPVPALILKHGSGGLAGPTGVNIRKWAATVAGWGVAALVVDSFGPRTITQTATNQSQLSDWADIADSLAALKMLAADPRIDKSRIGIMGWSRGGGAAMKVALETVRKAVISDDAKFAIHIVFYGPADAQYRDQATDKSPILFLHGESDDYVPMAVTREYSEWLKTMGNPVTFISYPKVFHDFDVAGEPSGLVKSVEVGAHCDLVIDISTISVIRMDHQDNPKVTLADIKDYFKRCLTFGATLGYSGTARADAVNKVHDFLQKNFHLGG